MPSIGSSCYENFKKKLYNFLFKPIRVCVCLYVCVCLSQTLRPYGHDWYTLHMSVKSPAQPAFYSCMIKQGIFETIRNTNSGHFQITQPMEIMKMSTTKHMLKILYFDFFLQSNWWLFSSKVSKNCDMVVVTGKEYLQRCYWLFSSHTCPLDTERTTVFF